MNQSYLWCCCSTGYYWMISFQRAAWFLFCCFWLRWTFLSSFSLMLEPFGKKIHSISFLPLLEERDLRAGAGERQQKAPGGSPSLLMRLRKKKKRWPSLNQISSICELKRRPAVDDSCRQKTSLLTVEEELGAQVEMKSSEIAQVWSCTQEQMNFFLCDSYAPLPFSHFPSSSIFHLHFHRTSPLVFNLSPCCSWTFYPFLSLKYEKPSSPHSLVTEHTELYVRQPERESIIYRGE